MQTNTYTAEVGRTSGAVINIITKLGGNDFHGSAYEFFRNDILDTTPFQFGGHNPKPELRQNQFGGSLGGRIIRYKTFFFADYEGLRQVQGQNPLISLVPTASQYAAIRTNPALLTGGASVDPVGLQYAMLYPQENDGEANGYGQFVSSSKVVRNSDTYDVRIDQHFNDRNTFYGRYTNNNVSYSYPGFLPAVNEAGFGILPGGNPGAFYGTASDKAQNGQLNLIHIFTPALLLQLQFGYTRLDNESYPLNYGDAINAAFGQPNINRDIASSGMAPVTPTGYAGLGGGGDFLPVIDLDNTFQYMGAVTWTKGAHNIKMGAGLIRRQATNIQSNNGTGSWTFNSTPSLTSLGSLLAGNFATTAQNVSLTPPHYRTWEPSVYIQDEWHARANLTLNLGLRYDVFTPFTEAHNAISTFNPETASIDVAGVDGVNDHAGLNTTYTNLAPRIGFWWTVAPKTVLRGGFGISYFPMNYTSNATLKNQPFVATLSCSPGSCPAGITKLAQGLPVPTAGSAANPTGSIPSPVDPGFRTSYLEQFNLTAEREFSGNVVAVSYVGMLGRHLAQIYSDQNIPAPISNSKLASVAASEALTPANAFNTLRPFYANLPKVTTIGGYKSEGASSYNALQVSFTRRAGRGLTLGGNYTLAHGLDDVTGFSSEGGGGYGRVPSLISTRDYSNIDLDMRSRGVITGNYELSFGKNLTGISGVLAKGWQLNTIVVWSTALPFTVLSSVAVSGTTYNGGSDRPEIRSAKVKAPTIAKFFDSSAFVPQPSGTLGSEPRNTLYGPHYRHADVSVFKTVPLHETVELQLRAECFNIANMTNFAAPNSTLQVAAPAGTDTYTVQSNNIGTITSTSTNYNPRQFQLVAKIVF